MLKKKTFDGVYVRPSMFRLPLRTARNTSDKLVQAQTHSLPMRTCFYTITAPRLRTCFHLISVLRRTSSDLLLLHVTVTPQNPRMDMKVGQTGYLL
jgi:hypothetical protein